MVGQVARSKHQVKPELKEQVDYQLSLILCEIRNKFDIRKFKSWDDDIAQLRYAEKHLEYLGGGSSREVFMLSNKYVLKIIGEDEGAGKAQNEAEVDLYTNPSVKPLVTKIYDFDKEYNWIISELVRELNSEDEFEELSGMKWMRFRAILEVLEEGDPPKGFKELVQHELEKPFFNSVYEMLTQTSLMPGDLLSIGHWGKTADGRIVLLDSGLTSSVWDNYYER
jgi:hypothetical protein